MNQKRTNPLRAPEVIKAIREFVEIEGEGKPGKPSGKDILAMVWIRFQVVANMNQLASTLNYDGIVRGGLINRGPGAMEIARHGARLRTHLARTAEKQRREIGPDPELIAVPEVSRQHDIAMARQVITRQPRPAIKTTPVARTMAEPLPSLRTHETPGAAVLAGGTAPPIVPASCLKHANRVRVGGTTPPAVPRPSLRQHQSAVPKVTLEPMPAVKPASPFSDRIYRAPQVEPAPIPYGRIITCCWPIGNPGTREFRYCDAPSEPNYPYCSSHADRAYLRSHSRRESDHGEAPGSSG